MRILRRQGEISYQEALEQQSKVETQASAKYEKVLSVKKLAKLYVGEEKFRRLQVRRLHVPGPM